MKPDSPFPRQDGPLLPRFHASLERIQDEQAIAKAVLEAGPNEEPATVARATLGGDSFRLRGIPVCARGVPGVSPGTDPARNILKESG